MWERHVAFCGLNKRYKDPTPRPRYPTQRLAVCNLVMMECLRMFWVSFLYSMLENLLERGVDDLQSWKWPVWDWNFWEFTQQIPSLLDIKLPHPNISWFEPIYVPSGMEKYTPQAISLSVRSPLSIDYVNYDSPSSACPVNTAPSHYSTTLPILQWAWDPWETWKFQTTVSSLFQCWCAVHFCIVPHRYPICLGKLWHEDRALTGHRFIVPEYDLKQIFHRIRFLFVLGRKVGAGHAESLENVDAYSGLHMTSVKWKDGPNPRISIAPTRDEVPVGGNPAPITWMMSPALRSIVVQSCNSSLIAMRRGIKVCRTVSP